MKNYLLSGFLNAARLLSLVLTWALLKKFCHEQQDVVCKPLNAMGGTSVFRIRWPDENASVILETLTHHGRVLIAAQRYISEIKQGDKRILLINGEPFPYALARIPASW